MTTLKPSSCWRRVGIKVSSQLLLPPSNFVHKDQLFDLSPVSIQDDIYWIGKSQSNDSRRILSPPTRYIIWHCCICGDGNVDLTLSRRSLSSYQKENFCFFFSIFYYFFLLLLLGRIKNQQISTEAILHTNTNPHHVQGWKIQKTRNRAWTFLRGSFPVTQQIFFFGCPSSPTPIQLACCIEICAGLMKGHQPDK